MSGTVELSGKLLRAFQPDSDSKVYVVPLSVGGQVRVTTGVAQARVGLFDSAVDGQPESMGEITTEPVEYERAPYIHDEDHHSELRVEDATETVDAWFLEVSGTLVATGPLGTKRNLGPLNSLTFEDKLLELV